MTRHHDDRAARVLLPGFLRRVLGAGAGHDLPCCAGCDAPAVEAVSVDPLRPVLGGGQRLLAWCPACRADRDEPGWVLPVQATGRVLTWADIDALVEQLPRVDSLATRPPAPPLFPPASGEAAGLAVRLAWWLAGRRTDRRAWAQALTLTDLGALTEAWLSGRVGWQPGYSGRVDVDEADAPGLTAALVGLNRAGFVTRTSQAGYTGPGFDAAGWVQHAAVDGYADNATVLRLAELVEDSPFALQARTTRRAGRDRGADIPVTFRAGRVHTQFGVHLSAREVTEDLRGAGPEAVTAAQQARQVVLWDPTPGRNALWAWLTTHLTNPPQGRTTKGDPR
jgi:hypothetical protein